MDFVANRLPQVQEMLAVLGLNNVMDLFKDVPRSLVRPSPQKDDGRSEYEGLKLMEQLALQNRAATRTSYLGAGAYEHHVPAMVGAIVQKSEFLTSYTPYQAEVSQGTLQTIFEYQSVICALTGLDVSNASLYDGASSVAEAVLMSLRLKTEASRVLIAESLHPDYLAVVRQYVPKDDYSLELLPMGADSCVDMQKAEQMLDESVAAIVVPYANFFGRIEDVKALAALAKTKGALTVLVANPIMYGAFATAADLGADMAVGDSQPLGIPLQFGGPYAGYMACKTALMRQLPGRIVGETLDASQKPGYVLTLQAREQHIRREKATSNICTSKALCALMSLITALWYGPRGLKELATTNFERAAYLQSQLAALPQVKLCSQGTHFNEFAIRLSRPIAGVKKIFEEANIDAGLDLGAFFAERGLARAKDYKDCLLIAVTETKSREDLDLFVATLKKALV